MRPAVNVRLIKMQTSVGCYFSKLSEVSLEACRSAEIWVAVIIAEIYKILQTSSALALRFFTLCLTDSEYLDATAREILNFRQQLTN